MTLKMLLFLVFLFIASCSSVPQTVRNDVELYARPGKVRNPAVREKVKTIVNAINERNRTVEKSPEWLKEAYSSIKLKNINNIPVEDYKNYRKYVDNDTVYIIVHPSYYTFFENQVILSSKSDETSLPNKNIVERFFEKYTPNDYTVTIAKEQERLSRSFVEFMSTTKRLTILVIPRDYNKYLTYGYIEGLDEYARYVNEITNMSESVVYIESKDYNFGNLTNNDLNILNNFLDSVGVKTILVGGGYIGRCLDGFYVSFTSKKKFRTYMVPEISAVSPVDLKNEWGANLLTDDGRINFRIAGRNIIDPHGYGQATTIRRQIMHISNYSFYPVE